MWEAGKLPELLQEAKRCDKQVVVGLSPLTSEQLERTFNRLMMEGRIRSAVRLVTDRGGGGGVPDPEDEAHGRNGPLGMSVYDVLQEKHPAQRTVDPSAFLDCEVLPPLEQVDITAVHIERQWQDVYLEVQVLVVQARSNGKIFCFIMEQQVPPRLREAIAASTRWHANEVVPWNDMRAFLARRGIALNKQPGVRPIGIGECRQRIEAKAMALATGLDVLDVCGSDQLCAGVKAGIEAAAHAMREMFEADESEGLLLVDAANAFNALNRPAALWNCQVLWPRCSLFLLNSYRGYAVILLKGLYSRKLFIILSQGGTTQGCPLAMLMYSIGVYPLISLLKDPKHYKQNWYTDDSACAGLLLCIRKWLLQLLRVDPSYGYFAEPSKSIIVVKEEHFQEAQDVFADLEVEVVLVGRFLGNCIGNESTEVQTLGVIRIQL